jgi:hypothetical protein
MLFALHGAAARTIAHACHVDARSAGRKVEKRHEHHLPCVQVDHRRSVGVFRRQPSKLRVDGRRRHEISGPRSALDRSKHFNLTLARDSFGVEARAGKQSERHAFDPQYRTKVYFVAAGRVPSPGR